MQNSGLIHYALFWNRNNSLQYAYFLNNGLQSGSMNRRFFEYHIWNDTNSTIIIYWLFSEANKGMLELGNLKQKDWASIQLLTLSVLTFLATLPLCQVVCKNCWGYIFCSGYQFSRISRGKLKTKDNAWIFF